MPISRGKSVTKSHWIRDMAQFYGMNIFLAETSATSGGLDSLLQPHGPIKKAQELAARAFGARRTYFVTNGTSTANKIVVQALVKPGDIILVDRDCHKSHHYGMVLPARMSVTSIPTRSTSTRCTARCRSGKSRTSLLSYKKAGKLDKVKMLLLTNCTFDGVVYNVERVMEECLAIKPDLIFLWDEAWFAFAGFTPTYRRRTAMATAGRLCARYRSAEYAAKYAAYASGSRSSRTTTWSVNDCYAGSEDRAHPRLRHPVDAQVADLAAPGFDDPRHDQDFGSKVQDPSTRPS